MKCRKDKWQMLTLSLEANIDRPREKLLLLLFDHFFTFSMILCFLKCYAHTRRSQSHTDTRRTAEQRANEKNAIRLCPFNLADEKRQRTNGKSSASNSILYFFYYYFISSKFHMRRREIKCDALPQFRSDATRYVVNNSISRKSKSLRL